MSETHYNCIECLEHVLLYIDFGFSESTAIFLAGLGHVCQTPAFGKLVKEHLVSRWKLTLPGKDPGRAYSWQ